MYLLIDRKRMVIVHRHESNTVLAKLAHIEMAHCSTAIFEEYNRPMWSELGYSDLALLYEGMCGAKQTGHMKSLLIDLLIRLAGTIEPSKVDSFEASLQASSIKHTDIKNYQYVWGSNKPRELGGVVEGKALRGNLAQAMALPVPTAQQAPQTAPQAVKIVMPVLPTAAPKYPPPWA